MVSFSYIFRVSIVSNINWHRLHNKDIKIGKNQNEKYLVQNKAALMYSFPLGKG